MKTVWLTCSLVVVAATGCEYLDKVGKERPNSVQQEAIGDIFAHAGAIGAVLDDPANASDGDLLDMFAFRPYVDLVDPDHAAIARVARRDALTAAGCIVVEGNTATFNCAIPVGDQTCTVTGSGSKAGNDYRGDLTLAGAACGGDIHLTAAFTLSGTSGSGTLAVDGTGATAFAVDLTLDSLALCENGLPNAGSMSVAVDVPSLALTDARTVVFGPDCGLAVFE